MKLCKIRHWKNKWKSVSVSVLHKWQIPFDIPIIYNLDSVNSAFWITFQCNWFSLLLHGRSKDNFQIFFELNVSLKYASEFVSHLGVWTSLRYHWSCVFVSFPGWISSFLKLYMYIPSFTLRVDVTFVRMVADWSFSTQHSGIQDFILS